MTDPFERAVARERLERHERVTRYVVGAFRWHRSVYLAVNALLVAIWAVTGADYFWPFWPIAGWGIGLFFHWQHTRHHVRRDREERERLEHGDVARDDAAPDEAASDDVAHGRQRDGDL